MYEPYQQLIMVFLLVALAILWLMVLIPDDKPDNGDLFY